MKSRLAILVVLAVSCLSPDSEVSAAESDAASTSSLAPILQSLVDQKLVAGVVGLVADKDQVRACDSAGCSSLVTQRRMQTGDLFWIASMTKPITATALMMLVDEGRIDIDDPVEKHLPEFKGQMVAVAGIRTGQPPQHPITIREVMNHTSGLVLASDRSLKRLHLLKDNVIDIASRPLRQEPGTKYEYNNCGIDTAARIIEVVSGKSYAEFMQTRLFDPLGMRSTTFWPNEDQAQRLAHSARRSDGGIELEEIKLDKDVLPALVTRVSEGISVPSPILADFGVGKAIDYARRYAEPAGGLFSTAEDLARFCQMLLNDGVWQGRRYLSAQAIRQMTSNQTGDIPVNPHEAYGIGWSVKTRDDEGPAVGSFGHRGARRPVMWVDPHNQLVMILLVERFDMTDDEQKVLYGSFLKAAIKTFGKP